MSQIDPEALSATNNLHELAREWIEHLRTVLYHSRVLTHQPLPDEYPLSEDFPFVRRAFGTTFPPFRTRAHFDNQQSLGLTEEVVYSVSLEYHPGSPEYNANWRIICGECFFSLVCRGCTLTASRELCDRATHFDQPHLAARNRHVLAQCRSLPPHPGLLCHL